MLRMFALRFLLAALAAIGLFGFMSPNSVAQEYQSIKFETASLVSPTSAKADYDAECTSLGTVECFRASTLDSTHIKERAKALDYDIDKIFRSIRDNVQTVPSFGLQAGAEKVVVEFAGTSFDQAHAMVALLQEADLNGKTYNPSYVLGVVSLDQTNLQKWYGLTNTDYASEFLANAGIPATVTGSGTGIQANIMHIWVEATVDGSRKVFDPSNKNYKIYPKNDVLAGTSYNVSTINSAARSGATVNATDLSNLNRVGLRSSFVNFTAELEQELHTNYKGLSIESALGGKFLQRGANDIVRQTTLPNQVSVLETWTTHIPRPYRSYLDIGCVDPSTSNVPGEFFADDNYFNPIEFTCNGSTTVTAKHPFVANSGNFMDKGFARANFTGFVTQDWGVTTYGKSKTTRRFQSRNSDALYYKGYTFEQDEMNAARLQEIPAQYSSFLGMSERINDVAYHQHHVIGAHNVSFLAVELAAPGLGGNNGSAGINADQITTLEPRLVSDYQAGISITALSQAAATKIDANKFVATIGLNIVENAGSRQEYDKYNINDALAVFSELQDDNSSSNSYYLANATNWTGIKTMLIDYPNDLISTLDAIIANGRQLIVPRLGKLELPEYVMDPDETGILGISAYKNYPNSGNTAFFLIDPANMTEAALLVYDHGLARVVKGHSTAPANDFREQDFDAPNFLKPGDSDPLFSSLDVGVGSGALSHSSSVDLSEGASYPYGLSLQRKYNSDSFTDIGIGAGWTHNWNYTVSLSNDSGTMFGELGVQGAASTIFTAKVISDILSGNPDIADYVISVDAAAWLLEISRSNLASITLGLNGSAQFIRGQNNIFYPVGTELGSLVQTGETLESRMNTHLYEQISFVYTGVDKSELSFDHVHDESGDGYLLTTESLEERVKPIFYMTDMSLPTGIELDLGYNLYNQEAIVTLAFVENNLGHRIEQFDWNPGSAGKEPYCDANDDLQFYPAENALRQFRNSQGDRVQYYHSSNHVSYYPGNPYNIDGSNTRENGDDQTRCDSTYEDPFFDPQFNSFATRTQKWRGNLKSVILPDDSELKYSSTTILRPPLVLSGASGPASRIGNMSAEITEFYRPSDTSPAITVNYGDNFNVRSLVDIEGRTTVFRTSTYAKEVESPAGNVTTSLYDQKGRLVEIIEPSYQGDTP